MAKAINGDKRRHGLAACAVDFAPLGQKTIIHFSNGSALCGKHRVLSSN